MTLNAKEFLAKRAQLQETTKTAQGAKVLSNLLSNKNILIGGGLLGLGALTAPTLESWGRKIQQKLVPDMRQRADVDHNLVESYAKTVGSELGKKTVGLLGDMVSKAMGVPAAGFQGLARKSVFNTLREEDDVLSQADPQKLEENYHTMVRFAPTLATDKNAVKAFLRSATLYDATEFNTLKQLADAERAVTEQPRY